MTEMLRQLVELEKAGARAVLATLVGTRGTTPRRAGATMLVDAAGRILGSVTIGGCVDARVVAETEAVLRDGRPRLLALAIDDDDALAIGLTCGGTVEVLLEPVDPRAERDPIVHAWRAARAELDAGRDVAIVAPLPEGRARLVVGADGIVAGTLGDTALDALAVVEARRGMAARGARTTSLETVALEARLYIESLGPRETVIVVGAGEVASALAALTHVIGMRTVVVDGRERYATRDRFPNADELHVDLPSEVVARIAGPRTYVALVAHDYKYELPVLREVLRRGVPYIGLLGSRKRAAAVKALLAEEGFGAAELARIRTPIGLDIGARTPSEIALAIAAELVAVREGKAPLAGVVAPAGALASEVPALRA